MKQGIHPETREVVFKDLTSDFAILTKSTIRTKDTIVWDDGKEYPLFKTDMSSQSHPFYTGKQRVADSEGRAERFKRKYASRK